MERRGFFKTLAALPFAKALLDEPEKEPERLEVDLGNGWPREREGWTRTEGTYVGSLGGNVDSASTNHFQCTIDYSPWYSEPFRKT